ncbi:hypothetical protein L2719_07220 [Shewanella schlegeliana]|uniref:DUF5658 domain-containing protein n=1 Tax=Shewanella schlegeliana TaxID=190308 RepID=A0ABS1SXY1_9GAMM|nr:hypothetical protein [Shewanella schlegeliana]MBL4913379.1 hypothetical protein [Shewanella schlegeliana]MCL1109334.1 hypothetical protein [Shewanella schlegeliana]GIU38110.1 hypothetical protein TUM4433_39320 [Shewanella schlegeliana]
MPNAISTFMQTQLGKAIFVIAVPLLQFIGPNFLIGIVRVDHEGVGTGLLFIFKCLIWVCGLVIASLVVSRVYYKTFRYGLWANSPLAILVLYQLNQYLPYLLS